MHSKTNEDSKTFTDHMLSMCEWGTERKCNVDMQRQKLNWIRKEKQHLKITKNI